MREQEEGKENGGKGRGGDAGAPPILPRPRLFSKQQVDQSDIKLSSGGVCCVEED